MKISSFSFEKRRRKEKNQTKLYLFDQKIIVIDIIYLISVNIRETSHVEC